MAVFAVTVYSVFTNHISKVQEGKYIKISRKELDDLLAPPSI